MSFSILNVSYRFSPLSISRFQSPPYLFSSITKGLIQNVHWRMRAHFAHIFSLFAYEFCSETCTYSSLFVSIQNRPVLNVIHLELPSHPGRCFGWWHLMCSIQSYVAEWGHLHRGSDRCRMRVSDASWCAVKECEIQNEILRSVSMSGCRRLVIYHFHMSFFTYLCLYTCGPLCEFLGAFNGTLT